jgi:hypothetical protein
MRRALVPELREAWARWFTHRHGRYTYARHPPGGTQHAASAYAFARPPVMLISVDVFQQRRDGSVRIEVVGQQLRWLRRVLRAANADPAIRFIIVQGHAPVLPVAAGFHSSRLTVAGGASSAFWHTLEAGHVDAYLTGEFHVIADANAGGVEQIAHGSILGDAAFNYLRVDVFPKRLSLHVYVAQVARAGDRRMWQFGGGWPLAHPVVERFVPEGSMEITADGRKIGRTGRFAANPRGPQASPTDGPGGGSTWLLGNLCRGNPLLTEVGR